MENEMSEIKIKPCPFCESQANHYGIANNKHYRECQNCLALIQGYDTAEDAAKAWNTRPDLEGKLSGAEAANADLKAENEKYRRFTYDENGQPLSVDGLTMLVANQGESIEQLEAEVERYKTALEHYADKTNWCPLLPDIRPDERIVYNGFEGAKLALNGYDIARTALGENK
jgi:hypothetical protein